MISVLNTANTGDVLNGSDNSQGSGELYYYDLAAGKVVFVAKLLPGIYTSQNLRDDKNIYFSHNGGHRDPFFGNDERRILGCVGGFAAHTPQNSALFPFDTGVKIQKMKTTSYFRKCFLFIIFAVLALTTACAAITPTPKTLAGLWQDDDLNVTDIHFQDGQFVAVTTYYRQSSLSQNTLISSSFESGVLTWKYCPPLKPCLTTTTVSLNSDTLDVTWVNDKGESGAMTLTRTENDFPITPTPSWE